MRIVETYMTDDGIEFSDFNEAKAHEEALKAGKSKNYNVTLSFTVTRTISIEDCPDSKTAIEYAKDDFWSEFDDMDEVADCAYLSQIGVQEVK